MISPRRLAVVIGLTQMLVWGTSFYVPAVVTSPVAAELGLSPTALFGGFSWALLITGLCSPRVGRWIERAGGRGSLALGCLLMGGGLFLLAETRSLFHWYACWTVIGVGMAMGLYDAAFATIGRLLGAGARPAIVGVTLIAGFASTIGWSSGAALVDLAGWRDTMRIYALVQIAVVLPMILLLVPRAEAEPPAAAAARPGVSAADGGAPDARRTLLLLGAFLVLRAAISGGVFVHLPAILRGLGLSAAGAIAAASLIGPAQVGARITDWFAGRDLDPMISARLGAAVLPLGATAALFGLPAYGFTVAYGISNGMLTISRGVLPLYLFGARGYAARMGRLAMPQMLVQAAAPTLMAPLVASLPATTLLAGVAVLSAAALLCLLGVRRAEHD